MIPKKIDRNIMRSGEFEETSMGVAEGSEAFIFNVLRNSLYQDKIGSPVREYIANALDEHVKANKVDVPVEVTFPTAFSNELRVRDFGFGLSDENVIKFFSKYGASDKRDSNLLIGAFGLGCKSAFAYTDSFTVVSFHKGRKTTFNLYIDETDVGKIAKLSSENTTEPDGVEIVIPVKPQDVGTFVQRGLALVKYFKTKPLIKGIANVPDFTREVSPVSGDNWKYFGDNRGSVIIQGQIGYPLDHDQMGQVAYYAQPTDVLPAGQLFEWEYDLLESGLEIEVPIGDVEVTASREQLQMTPKTISAVRKQLQKIRLEIIDNISEQFKTAKTLVEAKTAYYNFFQKGGSYGRQLHETIGVVKWNGQEIKDSTIHLDAAHKVMQYKKKYNGDIVLTTFDKIQCSDELNLWYDDTDGVKYMYKRRAKTLLDAGASQVTVLVTENAKKFQDATGLETSKMPQFSTITPTILASTRAAGSGIDLTKRVKHKVKVFELDWSKLKDAGRVRGAKSDYWKVAEIEIDNQVFVPIDRFEPNGMFSNSLRTMRQTLIDLTLMGVDVSKTPIYGVKGGIDTGNMMRLDEWALEQAKELPTLAAEVAIIKDFLTGELFELNIEANKFAADSLARDYAKQYQAAKKLMDGSSRYTQTEAVRARLNYADLIKLTLPDKGKLLKLSKDFKARYPMVTLMNAYCQTMNTATILDYISLVDEARD